MKFDVVLYFSAKRVIRSKVSKKRSAEQENAIIVRIYRTRLYDFVIKLFSIVLELERERKRESEIER